MLTTLPAVKILILCTGNICRSPMAEAFMRREAVTRAGEAAVTSAGFVTEGVPAEPHAVSVLADRGLSLSDHRSRLLTPDLLNGADLVVGMTREHVRRTGVVDHSAFPRTFTLKELVRRGATVGPVERALTDWLNAIGGDRDSAELMGEAEIDDIADPMGRSLRRFRACADEIEDKTMALADLLWAGDPSG